MALIADFTLTAGDTNPAITATLEDAAGAGVNLTGATVTFRMVPIAAGAGGTPKVNATATVTAALTGDVAYQWLSTDTDTPGYYLARWKVVYLSGAVFSFRNDGPFLVLIVPAV
jgi:hypothetical protein